jgi:pyruvate formate lyase activating enzyme
VSGCNFHCPYCHNPDLAKGSAACPEYLSEDWFFDFLKKRRGFLDGVVISGGEPTMQKDLPAFCKNIKLLGYDVKIDTNGGSPQVISQIIDGALVDYIALDLKTAPEAYVPGITDAVKPESILSSIQILMSSGIEHEFRTTCVKPFVDRAVIKILAGLLEGAERFYLQRAQDTDVLNPAFFEGIDFRCTENELEEFKSIAERRVKNCIIR